MVFFFLLTVLKRLIFLKDFGLNNVYFPNLIGRKIPHASGSKQKKSTGNGLKQKFFSTNSCFKTVENFLLIFRIKVCMLPYHIALDVVATNLHTMFFIDNIPIFVRGFMFSDPLQSNFA